MVLTPLRLAGIGLLGLVLLPLTERIPTNTSYREFVVMTCHHLMVVSEILLVAGLLLYVIFEALETHVKPIIEGEFSAAQNVLSNGFNAIANVFAEGFQRIEGVLAVRVGAIPTVLKDTIEKALNKIAENNFKTPGVRELVEDGKIDDAVAKISREEKQDVLRKKEEIAALLHSPEQEKWDAAAKILDEFPESREARFYQALAYLYWGAGQFDGAIETAEKGLDYATRVKDHKISAALQNSLAYYYADGNRHDKEGKAREYADAALKAGGPEDAAALDTMGFVLICFGKSKEEVLEGVNLCERARAKGAPFQFFSKHIQKAEIRLKALETDVSRKAPVEDPQGQA